MPLLSFCQVIDELHQVFGLFIIINTVMQSEYLWYVHNSDALAYNCCWLPAFLIGLRCLLHLSFSLNPQLSNHYFQRAWKNICKLLLKAMLLHHLSLVNAFPLTSFFILAFLFLQLTLRKNLCRPGWEIFFFKLQQLRSFITQNIIRMTCSRSLLVLF